jgi:zinc transporter 1/2/3
MTESGMAKIIGIIILEFGVVLHSVLTGLTLAVDEDFKILFAVLVFHRKPLCFSTPAVRNSAEPVAETFEGLGVGSRLAYLGLPSEYDWVPMAGALVYGLTTPIGIAAGLGVRTTYNPGSATASLVSGVMDSMSAGILIYTGLVEVRILVFVRATVLILWCL